MVDIALYIIFLTLTYLRETAALEHELKEDGHQMRIVSETYLLILSLALSFAKCLKFVRMYSKLGFLVRMLALTITEMVPFFIFFFCGSVFFAISFMIFDIKISVSSL